MCPWYSRKSPRIPGYDYAREGYWFVTVCTAGKKNLFWEQNRLNDLGEIAQKELADLENRHQRLQVTKSVVMPNHIHAIIAIGCDGKEGALPDLNVVIGQYKSGVSRRIHKTVPDLQVWQRSYHDHGIRNQTDYEKIWAYIDSNPQRWRDDCYFEE